MTDKELLKKLSAYLKTGVINLTDELIDEIHSAVETEEKEEVKWEKESVFNKGSVVQELWYKE